MVQADRIFSRKISLEPGELMTKRIIIYVPLDTVSWNRDNLEAPWQSERPDWIMPGVDFSLETLDVEEVSYSRKLTRAARTIAMAWTFGQPSVQDPDGGGIRVRVSRLGELIADPIATTSILHSGATAYLPRTEPRKFPSGSLPTMRRRRMGKDPELVI